MVKTDVLNLSFSKVPMLKPLIGLMAGIVVGKYVDLTLIPFLPYVIVICFLIIIGSQLEYMIRYRRYIFSLFSYVIFFLIGLWIISVDKPQFVSNHFTKFEAIQIRGIVDDEPIYKERTIRFPLKVISVLDSSLSQYAEGRIMITLLRDSGANLILNYGDVLTFVNKANRTFSPLNPKEFDYNAFLENKNIWHQCFLSDGEYKITAQGKGNILLEQSLHLRQVMIQKFEQYIRVPEAYKIAIALIFGYRSLVEASTLEAFTNTGTIHVLSVSGLHVSMVFGLLTFVLIGLDRFKYGKVIRCLFILIGVWGYVVLTGMSPPIMRAGIMISFFIISTVSGRRQVGINTLLASALFILILEPRYLFDIGFQLSYTAILGIILFYPLLKKWWLPNNKWLSIVVEYCYISISAQLFTLPFALYYFGQFPYYFLIANLFIAIPSTVVMYLGIVLALSPIDVLNVWLGQLLDWTLMFSLYGLKFIAMLPMAVSKGVLWDSYQVFALMIVLSLILITFNYANKRVLYFLSGVLMVLTVYTVVQKIHYTTYRGNRIYSVRSDIAIANIEKGNVILFSTCDSIDHPTLKFSVLPDLLRFANEENIEFVPLKTDSNTNYELSFSDQNFLILEEEMIEFPETKYDYVIWRKSNRNDIRLLMENYPDSKIIIDGSNSEKAIHYMEGIILNNTSIYILKNNFAYVWDEE